MGNAEQTPEGGTMFDLYFIVGIVKRISTWTESRKCYFSARELKDLTGKAYLLQ